MTMKRCKGFVVGQDPTSGGTTVWKVRVKDSTSPHDGEKLVVASVRNDIELAKGLNVNFLIGSVDGPKGQKVPRAVDVLPDMVG
jgi:hypothetical protein